MSSKKTKAQLRIFGELENQLLVQAERLGICGKYTPLYLKELKLAALKKHLLAFYSERSNLEYEMQMTGTDKKETLIKLERLGVYIKRGETNVALCERAIQKLLDKATPNRIKAAVI